MHTTTHTRRLGIAATLAAAMTLAACGGSGDSDDAAAGEDTPGSEDTADSGGEDTEGGGSGELTEVIFAQPVPQSVIQWPSYVAEQLGYFEEEGIRMSLAPASDTIPLPTFVNSGDADIAAAGASEVLFSVREGATLKVVFDWWTRSAEGIVTPEGTDIQSVEDLAGRTVGVASDEDRAFLAAALGTVGVSPDDVPTVVVGEAGPSVANSLNGGEIEAFAGATSDFAALEAAGVSLRDVTPEELAATPASSFVVSDQTLAERRDLVVGFARAYAKATHAGITNPEALMAMSQDAVPEEWREEEAGRALMEVVVENATPEDPERIGEVRPDVWADAQQQLIDVGEMTEPLDLDSILTNDLIEEINDFDRAEVEADVQQWLEENQ